MSAYFFNLFVIVFWNLGLTITTQEGYILYFLRKPFDNLYDSKKKRDKIILYLFKPILLCITCMASFWGLFWYLVLSQTFNLFVLCSLIMAASFIQTFIFRIYAKLD